MDQLQCENPKNYIGSRLINIQNILNVSDDEFADHLDISKEDLALCKINSKHISPHMIAKLYEDYCIGISYLLFGRGNVFVITHDMMKYELLDLMNELNLDEIEQAYLVIDELTDKGVLLHN